MQWPWYIYVPLWMIALGIFNIASYVKRMLDAILIDVNAPPGSFTDDFKTIVNKEVERRLQEEWGWDKKE